MPHGPTKFPSKGVCIYCGANGFRLTDEHIVPLSLGGQHVIEEASCYSCADVTKKFEQDVARELWGDARTSYNAPSRRKKQRKTHIILTDPKNPQRTVKVPYADYPAPIVFYKMSRAGFLEGMPETLDISASWKLEVLSDYERNRVFEEKYGIPLTARFRHVPISFARVIAKIGYGHILSILDPGDFRPICLPYILGTKANLSYVVGSAVFTGSPDAGIGYSLGTRLFGSMDHLTVIATIRLFANNLSPTYHVIVGDIVGRETVARAMPKIGPGQMNILAPPAPFHLEPAKEQHWLPSATNLAFWRSNSGR